MIARKNLKFNCTGCGGCCEKPGWVFFNRADRVRAARLLRIKPSEFSKRHGGDADGSWIQVTRRSSCPFFRDKACAIYAARPEQCRTFPYWSRNMRSWRAWNELCRSCPGAEEGGSRSGRPAGGRT